MKSRIDLEEVVKRAVKYLVEGIMVAIAAFLIPDRRRQLKIEEVVMLGLTAAAVFAVLDMFCPSTLIASSVRTGAGFGIGAGLVQWPGALGPMKGLA